MVRISFIHVYLGWASVAQPHNPILVLLSSCHLSFTIKRSFWQFQSIAAALGYPLFFILDYGYPMPISTIYILLTFYLLFIYSYCWLNPSLSLFVLLDKQKHLPVRWLVPNSLSFYLCIWIWLCVIPPMKRNVVKNIPVSHERRIPSHSFSPMIGLARVGKTNPTTSGETMSGKIFLLLHNC